MLSLSAIGKFINDGHTVDNIVFSGGTPLKTARQTRGTPLNKLTVDLIKTYKKINDHYYARKRRIKGIFQNEHESYYKVSYNMIFDKCRFFENYIRPTT